MAVAVLWAVVGEGKQSLLLDRVNSPASRGGAPVLYLKLIGAIVPWWAAVAVTAMLPIGHAAALTLDYVNRRRQRRAGLCPSCRYDLTGSVSGVCPECGRPASTGDAA